MIKKTVVQKTKWSTPQLQAHIRKESLISENVIFLPHTNKQMKERKITKDMAMDALQKGSIKLKPELEYNTGDIKCRMEFYTAGKDVKMVVAISDDKPKLILITAI